MASSKKVASKHGSIRAGVGLGAVSAGLTAIIGLASTVFTARLYGMQVVGQFAQVFIPMTVVGALSNVQHQRGLIAELQRYGPGEKLSIAVFIWSALLSQAITIGVSIAVTLAVLVGFSGVNVDDQRQGFALILIGSYLLFANPAWNIEAYLAAFRRSGQLFWLRLARSLMLLAVVLGFAVVQPTLIGLVAAIVGSHIAWFLLGSFMFSREGLFRLNREDFKKGRQRLRSVYGLGIKLTPTFAAQGLSSTLPSLVLAHADDVRGLAAYNRSWSLANKAQQLGQRTSEMLLSGLVQNVLNSDSARFAIRSVEGARFVALITLPLATMVATNAHAFISILGPEYSEYAFILACLGFVGAMQAISNVLLQAPIAGDQWRTTAWIACGSLALLAVLVAYAEHKLGVSGAAAAFVVSSSVQVLLLFRALNRQIDHALFDIWRRHEFLALILALAATAVVGSIIRLVLPGQGLKEALFACALSTGAFLAALNFFGGVRAEDKLLVNGALKRIFKRSRLAKRSSV